MVKKNIVTSKKTTSQMTWAVSLIVALLALAWLLKPYWLIIIVSIIAAVLFNGVYKTMTRKLKGSRPAGAAVTSLFVVLLVGVPVITIVALATAQAVNFINNLQVGDILSGGFSLDGIVQNIVDGINSAAQAVVGSSSVVNPDQVMNFIHDSLPKVLSLLTNLILGLISSIPSLFMNLIIFFFVFTGLLVNQENIAKRLSLISPFGKEQNDMISTRAIAMTKAMLKGQLLIAFLQGLAGAGSLAVIGLGQYFLAFTLIFTLMSIVPLGSGIILIPLGIIMIPFGLVWQGLFILFVHFVITTNIDNVVRPKVVPKEAWMPAAATILSAFAGVYYMGLVGVIVGPILMSVGLAIVEAYTDMKAKKTAS